jgi:glycosyltransferase involved in cell wall biosynthesis
MCPDVSICLPLLNAGRYLESRLDSIANQSFSNWELVVIDGFSDDGSWELVNKRYGGDSRATLNQRPRQGVYKAINEAIRLARGDYVYIATADDTMEPECIERLLQLARRGGANCIAQCGLCLINEEGISLDDSFQWPSNAEWFSALGTAFEQSHYRRAPYDGAAVLLFGTLITSLTQALFPRSAFHRLGGFPSDFGSAGDMAWEGLAGFFYDVSYTPERLATWRFHGAQATRNPIAGELGWAERRVRIGDWIIDELRRHDEQLANRATVHRLTEFNRFWKRRLASSQSSPAILSRVKDIVMNLLDCRHFYCKYLMAKVFESDGDPVTVSRMKTLEAFVR